MRERANGIGMDFVSSLITQSEQPEFCSGLTLMSSGAAQFQDGRRTRLVCGQSHPPLLGAGSVMGLGAGSVMGLEAGSVMGLGADGMKGEVFWGNLPCPQSKEKREKERVFSAELLNILTR